MELDRQLFWEIPFVLTRLGLNGWCREHQRRVGMNAIARYRYSYARAIALQAPNSNA